MSEEFLLFRNKKIPLSFNEQFVNRYRTPNFYKMQDLIKTKGIQKKKWNQALNWFFQIDRNIPLRDKITVEKITVIEETGTFCIEMGQSKNAYRNLEYLTTNTGWYFYLTGIKLGESKLCDIIDKIQRRFNKTNIEKFSFSENENIELINISTQPNSICFLLKLGKYNILLDAGISEYKKQDLISLKSFATKLDIIFLSHAHYDHYRGLEKILEIYPNSIILCSQTTLDFFVYRYSNKKWDDGNLHFELNDITKKIINNTLNISSGESISFNNGKFISYFSGHMPGALMLNIDVKYFNFIYTGDFSYFDYHPISGARNIVDYIRKPVDFILVDASMCDKSYNSPGRIFNTIKKTLRYKAQFGKQVLIAADPASIAIILYITIFNYFRSLQLEEGFDKRPTIIMGREALEYVKIIQKRKKDLHPVVKKKIEKKLNPFTSALTHFCSNFSEIISFLNRRNIIFIFGSGDCSSGLSKKLLMPLGCQKNNLICLTGALRSEEAMELASGNNTVKLDNIEFINQADVFNFKYPKNDINLHADSIQIDKFIEDLKPARVGLFHNTPRKMVPIRANLLKKKYVKKTYSFGEKTISIKLR